MSIPSGIALSGGANVWLALGASTALSVVAGLLLATIEKHLPVRATVETIARPAERVLDKAA